MHGVPNPVIDSGSDSRADDSDSKADSRADDSDSRADDSNPDSADSAPDESGPGQRGRRLRCGRFARLAGTSVRVLVWVCVYVPT